VLSHVDEDVEAARARLNKIVASGAALERFRKNVEAQGGDARVCDDPGEFLPLVAESFRVESPRSGFITKVNTAEIGHAIASIGGGRVRIDDTIDPSAGFVASVRIGDQLSENDLLGTIYCRDESKAREAATRIQAAYEVDDQPVTEMPQLIKEVINE
jgi:pyrimidine-nucleoside phosphorylase